ncbi:MAG: hypothetical protein ABIE74_03045 [Pseudomonadota bacterium]
MRFNLILSIILVFIFASCAKPLMSAKVNKNVVYISKSVSAPKDKVFEAATQAMGSGGYSIAVSDKKSGHIESVWVASTSDSHYLELFDRRDYGVTGTYHQLVVDISDDDGKTLVKVGSRIKTLAGGIKSSKIEEKSFLKRLGDFLRKGEPGITNLGITE